MKLIILLPALLLLVTLDLCLCTTDITTEVEDNSFIAGNAYTLTCTSTAADIVWKKGEVVVSTGSPEGVSLGDVTTDNGGTTHQRTLTFSKLFVSHGDVYTCSAGSETDTIIVNVQMPSTPGTLPSLFPNPLAVEYFAGTKIGWYCHYTQVAVINEADYPDIAMSIKWLKDNTMIVQDNRVSYETVPRYVFGFSYRADLSFSYVTLSDSDVYKCEMTVYATTNTQYTTNDTAISDDLTITIDAPFPDVSLTAASTRVPAHSSYNTIMLTCSDVLPLPDAVDQLEFDKVYTWKMGGVDITGDASSPVDPEEVVSYAELNKALSQTGEVVFSCNVSIAVPGDPVINVGDTLTITVLASSLPHPPTDLGVSNITYDSAHIHWVVPLIAYTPEQYTVYYGTSLGSLASYPTTVAGSTNFSSVDLDYSLNITGLTFDTLYYFYIEASNTEGEATSVTMNFTTLVVTVPASAPRNFTATATDSKTILFSWSNLEESARNAPIQSYTIRCDSSPTPVVADVPSLPSLEATNSSDYYTTSVEGFMPYTMYTCLIYASNSGGAGPNVTTPIRTLEDKPGTPPTNVTVTGATNSSVIVTWSLPSVPNGIITRYTVYVDLLNGTTSFIPINGALTEYTVTDLGPYQLVQVGVSASTDIGEGSQSSPVEGRSLESAPGPIVGVGYHTLSPSRLKVNFTTPLLSITRGVILYYEVTVTEYGSDTPLHTQQVLGNGSVIEAEFTRLNGETPYVVALFAVNSAGAGEVSESLLFTVQGVPPSPLTVNSIRVNATHMNVTWRPIPLTLSRGFITQYVISYSRVATGKRQSGLVIVPGNQTFIVIGDLAADARYSVTVTAGTAAGLGDESLETIVEQSEAPQSEEFLTPTNIIILTCCIAGVLILLLAVLLIVAVCKRRSSSNKSVDLPTKLRMIPPDIEMGPSLAYGHLPGTPEPLDDDQEPLKKLHISAQNPTYNSAQQIPTYNYAYGGAKSYEHTYESIDNLMSKRVVVGEGLEPYDVPKPQLPAPRPSVSNISSGQSSIKSDIS